MRILPLTPRRAAALLAFAAGLPALASAQSSLVIRPVGATTNDWLNEVAESPNGRFFALRSYDGDRLAIYDARLRRWSTPGVAVGGSLSWSPDGRFIAYASGANGQPGRYVWILPMDSATGLPSAAPRRVSIRGGTSPAWSADGRRIAFASSDSGSFRVVAIPFNGGDERVLFSAPGRGTTLAWSADGRTIVALFGEQGHERWVRLDVATGKATTMPSGSPWPIVDLSRDGRQVATWNPRERVLTVLSSADGKVLATHQLPDRVAPGRWTRDGSAMLAAEHVVPSHLQQVRVADGVITSLTAPDSVIFADPVYSPDGSQLFYARTVDGVTRLEVKPARGGNARTVGAPHRAAVGGSYAWAPSGRSVVYCTTREVRLVDVATGEDRLLAGAAAAPPGLRRCAWRADGGAVRWLYSPYGQFAREHEVHETTPAGSDRVIARFTAPGMAAMIGDTLVSFVTPEGLMLRHLVTGQERVASRGTGFSPFAQLSSDGRTLLTTVEEDGNYAPVLLDVRTGSARKVPYSLGGEIGETYFHPDGRNLVAYVCTTCVSPRWVEKWDIALLPLNGGPARVLTAGQKSYRDHGSPAVSPDGSTMVFVGETSYHTRVVKLVPPTR